MAHSIPKSSGGLVSWMVRMGVAVPQRGWISLMIFWISILTVSQNENIHAQRIGVSLHRGAWMKRAKLCYVRHDQDHSQSGRCQNTRAGVQVLDVIPPVLQEQEEQILKTLSWRSKMARAIQRANIANNRPSTVLALRSTETIWMLQKIGFSKFVGFKTKVKSGNWS